MGMTVSASGRCRMISGTDRIRLTFRRRRLADCRTVSFGVRRRLVPRCRCRLFSCRMVDHGSRRRLVVVPRRRRCRLAVVMIVFVDHAAIHKRQGKSNSCHPDILADKLVDQQQNHVDFLLIFFENTKCGNYSTCYNTTDWGKYKLSKAKINKFPDIRKT